MRYRVLLPAALVIVCLVSLASQAMAWTQQSGAGQEAYEALMEAGNQRSGALKIHIEEKDGAAALEDATLLDKIFGQIAAYFENREAADAVEFAKNAQAGFKEAGALASQGKMQEAMTKYYATRANCDGCHQAHRERAADGSWKIK